MVWRIRSGAGRFIFHHPPPPPDSSLLLLQPKIRPDTAVQKEASIISEHRQIQVVTVKFPFIRTLRKANTLLPWPVFFEWIQTFRSLRTCDFWFLID
jgi:hypothetical protein